MVSKATFIYFFFTETCPANCWDQLKPVVTCITKSVCAIRLNLGNRQRTKPQLSALRYSSMLLLYTNPSLDTCGCLLETTSVNLELLLKTMLKSYKDSTKKEKKRQFRGGSKLFSLLLFTNPQRTVFGIILLQRYYSSFMCNAIKVKMFTFRILSSTLATK